MSNWARLKAYLGPGDYNEKKVSNEEKQPNSIILA